MSGALPPLDCTGCTTCCKGDTITLQSGDDATLYETTRRQGATVLKHGRDGNCVYLTPTGCRIHGRAPVMCRALECREYYRMVFAMPSKDRRARYADPRIAATLAIGKAKLAEVEP